MRYLISKKDLFKQTVDTKTIEYEYSIILKKQELGIKVLVFDGDNASTGLPRGTRLSHITKEFKNIPEYRKALYTAGKLIDENKEVPSDLREKLIRTKNDIEKYEKEHGLILFIGY